MKSILHALAYLLAGLLAGFAVAAWFSADAPDTQPAAFGTAGSPQRRLERLEAGLDAVLARTAELQLRLDRLDDELRSAVPLQPAEAESTAPPRAEYRSQAGERTADAEPRAAEEFPAQRRTRGRDRDLQSALTSAGFAPAEAQRIESRIEQLRLEAMQSRYEALRSAEPGAPIEAGREPLQRTDAALRAELGDADYERFLAATGRPTSVGVTSVIGGSAAETAGVLPGDEIRAYGGERVFDVRDLNRLLLEGEPGEPVLVDIVRDGQPVQVAIPRGPLGIASGFARRGLR